MFIITYSDARKNFKGILDKVHENKEPFIISRKNLHGFFSRRIDFKHRLVYRSNTEKVKAVQCRNHY